MDDRHSELELCEELKHDLERHFACHEIYVLWTAQNMTRLADGESTSTLLGAGYQLYAVFPSENLRGPDEETIHHLANEIVIHCWSFADYFCQLTGFDIVGAPHFARKQDAHGMPLFFIALTPA